MLSWQQVAGLVEDFVFCLDANEFAGLKVGLGSKLPV
jgi:hypothetical protein